AAPDHPLALGVRQARELAGRTGRLMVVSDLAPALRGQPELEGALGVSVGEPLANVGIVGAERSLSPAEGRGTISLTLANDSASPARRRLDVSGRRTGQVPHGAVSTSAHT